MGLADGPKCAFLPARIQLGSVNVCGDPQKLTKNNDDVNKCHNETITKPWLSLRK